jgi:hypothetical protein
MFIFVLLNLICLSIILAKFIWHSENSRRTVARNIDKIFGVPIGELEIIREEQDTEELNHTCDHCIDACNSDEDDDKSHDSMPDLIEAEVVKDDGENTEEARKGEVEEETNEEGTEESDDVSIEHVNAEDVEVINKTLDDLKQSKEMLEQIKSDLEKKVD